MTIADRWPSSFKTAFAGAPRSLVCDVATNLRDVEDILPSCRNTLQVLDNWIAQCGRSHSHCTLTKANTLPKRVLQLSADTVCIREYPQSHATYACLSHCWGTTGPKLKLTSTTYDRLTEGVPISDLPATFRDAVSVCQSLRISFLWLDALCIKQDDIDDWMQTAAQMASIYENAYVTLGATYALDSNGGLFARDQDLTPKRLACNSKIYVKEQKETYQLPLTYRQFSTGKHSRSIKECSLLLRAWVYQERRLS
ncbi:heterokaryon incompatibility protein-domain-containing protein [Ampelomyces quisqualis]|uniref:Heterokaryon incompatibility protein-domain-containing protein n=1 Tax=Ampelomyces quisqualis TaxID=50730 RepID=A0A6A5QYU9_AMPQU|nr:heterokaryon incompatibility protein-domain-containing protein [Ampelomyces quisqualis]